MRAADGHPKSAKVKLGSGPAGLAAQGPGARALILRHTRDSGATLGVIFATVAAGPRKHRYQNDTRIIAQLVVGLQPLGDWAILPAIQHDVQIARRRARNEEPRCRKYVAAPQARGIDIEQRKARAARKKLLDRPNVDVILDQPPPG